MKFAAVALSFATLAFGAAVLDERALVCNANNCNRAVTATRNKTPDAASRSADCSAFLLTTVTPSPVTVTVTVDGSATTAPAKRDLVYNRQVTVSPSAIPVWASTACSNSVDFATACSCWSITGSVTTVATPTVTATTTIDYCDDL